MFDLTASSLGTTLPQVRPAGRFTTNPGWPNPNDWSRHLRDELERRAALFEAENDPAIKRNIVAHMIGFIAGHLQMLPSFKGSDCLRPVKDLLIFFEALEGGSGHPWAKAINFGGTNRETLAETEVRIWAIFAVWSLIEAGWKPNRAYHFVADRLTASGRKPKGKPMSHRNVQRWYLAYVNSTDVRLGMVDTRIKDFWNALPCDHGHTMNDCPSTPAGRCDSWPQVALEFADKVFTYPSHRDWFVWPSKNEPM